MKPGMATEASTPTKATTISTSTRVNPASFLVPRIEVSPLRSRGQRGGPGASPALLDPPLRLEHALARVAVARPDGLRGQVGLVADPIGVSLGRLRALLVAPRLRGRVVVDVRDRAERELVARHRYRRRVVEVDLALGRPAEPVEAQAGAV